MKKTYTVFSIVICLAVVLSCTKEPLKSYSGANNIYFPWVGIADHSNVPYGRTPFDTIRISFGHDAIRKIDSIIYIPIQVQGYQSNVDRIVNLSVEPDSGSPIVAVAGVDYSYPDQIVLKAGQVTNTIPLTLYHTDALDSSYCSFTLVLNRSSDFEVNYNYLANGSAGAELNPTRISIQSTGILTKPSNWVVPLYGIYTRKKWDTMVQEIDGFTYEVFEDPDLDLSYPNYWINVMNAYFVKNYNDPADHSGQILEDDGSVMTMGKAYPMK